MKKREIKFRGISTDTKEWVYGGVCVCGDKAVIIHRQAGNLMQHTDVIPKTVGQLAGEDFTSGKEIFEGDIVKCYDEVGEVQYDEQSMAFIILWYPHNAKRKSGSDHLGSTHPSPMKEIVGNIHEHGEFRFATTKKELLEILALKIKK